MDKEWNKKLKFLRKSGLIEAFFRKILGQTNAGLISRWKG